MSKSIQNIFNDFVKSLDLKNPNRYINLSEKEISHFLSVDEVENIRLNEPERWNSLDYLPYEIWREIPWTNGRYSVSVYGRIKQNSTKILYSNSNRSPYYRNFNESIVHYYLHSVSTYPVVEFCGKRQFVHRIVADVFLVKDEYRKFVDHINTIRGCSHIFNLRYCSLEENMNNPLTKLNSSLTKKGKNKFKIETDENASSDDNIVDYLTIDNIFSPRMFSLVDFKGEMWKYVDEFDLYVSNLGRIKKYDKNNKLYIIKQTFNKSGYLTTKYKKFTHRLVMETFVGSMPADKDVVDHKNTIRFDNRVENLHYVTREENSNNELSKKNMKNNLDSSKYYKSVLLYDAKTGEFINEYKSVSYLEEEMNMNGIVNAIKHRSVLLGKYIVTYKSKNNIPAKIQPADKNYFKSISKYSLDGTFIETYDSVYDVSDDYLTRNRIINCCDLVSKSVNGFMWRYSDGTNNNIAQYKGNREKYIAIYDEKSHEHIRNYNTMTEASIDLNINTVTIFKYCKSGLAHNGYYFRYINDINDDRSLDEYSGYTELCDYKFKENNNRQINKYSLDGEYIETIENIYSLKGTLRHRALQCCLGTLSMYNGYMWKFTDEVEGKEQIEPYIFKTKHPGEFMKINMYDIYGNYIRTFENTKDVIENVGFKVSYSQLVQCCNGQIETLKGYFFRYTYKENNAHLWDSGLYYVNDSNDIYQKSQFNYYNPDNKDFDKVIVLYDAINGNLIKRYYSTIACSKEIKCNRSIFWNASLINNKYIVKIYNKNDNILLKVNPSRNPSIRKVNRYDLNGKYICTYNNLDDVELNGIFKRSDVLKACNRVSRQYRGFQWRWAYYENCDDIPSVKDMCKTGDTINNKCIAAYEYPSMKLIGKFNTSKEATQTLQIVNDYIVAKCCRLIHKKALSKDGKQYTFRYEDI